MNRHLYSIAANAILGDLISDIRANVPNIFDYQGKMLAAAPGLATKYGVSAVDALLEAHGIAAST